MSDENIREIYKVLQTSQDKYIYFKLAAAMTSIAFAITQTKSLKLSITQVPVGLSVLCWGISIYFGLTNRAYYNSTLYANVDYIRMKSGQIPSPQYGNHPDYIQAASEGIKEAMKSNSKKVRRYGSAQTLMFYCGAIFYVVWHVLEMYLRV